jgi:hypothetical protein
LIGQSGGLISDISFHWRQNLNAEHKRAPLL